MKAIKERPIIFSADSVKQIFAGAKTQTRRVMKPQPELCLHDKAPSMWAKHCPYGAPGMRLWVREAFWAYRHEDSLHVFDDAITCLLGWQYTPDEFDMLKQSKYWSHKSPIYLPRRYSRLTLEITNVRCERLKDISDADLASEGYKNSERYENLEEFKITWDPLNFKRGFGWETNPWVWVLEFKKVESEVLYDKGE